MRIEKEYKRYGRRRQRRNSTPAPSRSSGQKTDKPKSSKQSHHRKTPQSGTKATKSKLTSYSRRRKVRLQAERPKPVNERPVKPVDRQRQRKAINRLLEDLYGSPRYLSDILQSRGFSLQEIARLRQDCLPAYLDSLIDEIKTFWRSALGPHAYDMLRTKYALDGEPTPSDESLAAQYGLSGRTIPAVRGRALHRLRLDDLIARFERLVAYTASEVLKKEFP